MGDKCVALTMPRPRRLHLTVASKDYKSVVKLLVKKKEILHISTISGVDTGKEIEILPHLFGQGTEITIKTSIPRDKPIIDSITDLLPGAMFFEKEVHDLLGVRFRGHPNLTRLILPEDWPEGVHPLRKDFKLNEHRKKEG